MSADEAAILRDAIREGHALLRDLRTERRAVQQMLAGIEGRVQRAVGERLEAAAVAEIARLGEATERAMRESVAKVGREFDRLERILTGREPGSDRPPLEDQLREAAARGLASAAARREGRFHV